MLRAFPLASQFQRLAVAGAYVPKRMPARPLRAASTQAGSVSSANSVSPANTAAKNPGDSSIVFRPFEEVLPELQAVDEVKHLAEAKPSFARVRYSEQCEAAINEQINVEYTISVIYHSFYAFFARDNVGLPGIAEFFRKQSEEERGHAEMFMKYQNRRGGRVQLATITAPQSEYDNEEKGEALHAFELALSLEKLNYNKLWALDDIASKSEDYELASYVEEILQMQAEEVKRAADQVAQLRRVGKGLGVFEFDRSLAATEAD
jgi:ferritin heavy chain